MNYRSIKTLNQDIIDWIPRLPREIDLIVGVPRSGLLAANLLSLHVNLPLADLDGFLNSRIIGSGKRHNIAKSEDFLQKRRKVLVIDDSLFTGHQMNQVKEVIHNANLQHEIYYAAVYVAPDNQKILDFYYEFLPMPRVFEWNFMHHADMQKWCVDIDGVLCRDPTEKENDDGQKYIHFLKTVQPLIIPSNPVGWLVTCRLEKYREITNEWLERHGIKFKNLIMMDFPDKESRVSAGSHSTFKANIYKDVGAALFIESSLNQAREIAQLSRRDVLCIETREMINPSFIQRNIHKQHLFFRLLLTDPKGSATA